jgi:hypothetical protein
VDALDESKDDGTTSIILSSLSRYVAELSPLKVLVTSRPEQNITCMFQSKELSPATQRLILHEVELEVVQNDIAQYLSRNLCLIGTAHKLEQSWPSDSDVQSLAHLSSGLFIFAATSLKFVDDRNYSDPRGQLAHLLSYPPQNNANPPSLYDDLDRLYAEVLTHAFPNVSDSLSGRLKLILGTIALLRDPLASLSLEHMLNLETGTIQNTLMHLHSVIIVPDDDTQVIRFVHKSFFDFITTRCLNPKFIVNEKKQHTLLARACLEAMKNLKRDMCEIRNPSVLNSEIQDLPTRIMTNIPVHLQYACRHWSFHLTRAIVSEGLLDLVEEFSLKYLLHWVEACSLLGELRNALLALDAVNRAMDVCHHFHFTWFTDAHRI